jgi:hypothetical protein
MRSIAILLVIVLASPTIATDAAVPVKPRGESNCEILDAGLTRSIGEHTRHDDSSSPSGDRYEVEDVEFIRQTKVVPLEIGRAFGIRYKLRGLSKTKASNISWRIVFPRPIQGKGHWGRGDSFQASNGELVQHLVYELEHSYELVAGTWRFEVNVEGKQACSVAFQVK